MKKRNAIITGGTSGIGLAIAEEFLRRGHNVFICGRNEERLTVALRELAKAYDESRIGGVLCNVSNMSEVEALISKAVTKFTNIDVVINNAGIGYIKPFDQISSECWNAIINTNLSGVFNVCKAVVPYLKKNLHSDIINIGSRSGRYSFKGGVGYNTTKFGLQGFSEALFLDLSQFGIRVSLVAPGSVATGFAGGLPRDWYLQPNDVAKIIADMLNLDPRAAVNWLEIRPARPE